MSERKYIYPILSCQLKVLQCLNIIYLKYELYDKGGKDPLAIQLSSSNSVFWFSNGLCILHIKPICTPVSAALLGLYPLFMVH